MKLRITAFLLLLLFITVTLPIFIYSDEPQTVKVGWYSHPGGSEKRNGEYYGYNHEYLLELAKYTGWSYEYVEADFAECAEMLANGEIDLLGGLYYSDERAEIYDFASVEYGYSYTTLFTRTESDVTTNDFAAFDGMNIGVISRSVNSQYFAEFAAENDFTYSETEYAGIDALTAAVISGEVDAGIIGAFTPSEQIRSIAVFSPLPIYFAVPKGDERLLAELDDALDQIKITNPYIEADLYSKYFGETPNFDLTEKENELIRLSAESPIKIGIISSSPPICYENENGEFDGVFISILQKISEKYKLKFEYHELDLSEKNAIGWLRSGEVSAVIGVLKTEAFLNDSTLVLSDTLLDDTIVLVGRENDDFTKNPEQKTIAVPSGFQVGMEYAAEQFPRHKIANYSGETACLDAVANGEADAMLYMRSSLNYVLQNPHYENMTMLQAFRSDISPCVAALSSDGETLISILNKGLSKISNEERSSMMIDYTLMNPYKLTVSDMLYKYRMSVIVISLLLIAIIAVLTAMIIIRRHAENNLQKAYNQEKLALETAERASEAKGNFMSRMSHEIRTPLNALIGYNSLAREELNRAEVMKTLSNGRIIIDYLNKSDVASRHLLTIINDVLDMSAIESGKIKVVAESFEFNELLESLSAIFASQAESKGVKFSIDSSAPEGIVLIGDRMRINQILTNLLSNAVKFTQNGSVTLTVGCEKIDDKKVDMSFKVSDTGIGMDREYLEHIWMPFEQADNTIARRFGGTGLGLAITKNLCDLMNGKITVESEKGKGTVFELHLTLERSENNKKSTRSKKIKYDFGGAHIMLVEDNAMNMEVAERLLTAANITVDKAWNGRQAYDLFISKPPYTYKAILMDIQMPEVDGYEATKLIRSSGGAEAGAIPIIAMTADAFAENVAEAIKCGMNAHIAKPIDVKSMFETLKKYIT